jgi:hypothetical protein
LFAARSRVPIRLGFALPVATCGAFTVPLAGFATNATSIHSIGRRPPRRLPSALFAQFAFKEGPKTIAGDLLERRHTERIVPAGQCQILEGHLGAR